MLPWVLLCAIAGCAAQEGAMTRAEFPRLPVLVSMHGMMEASTGRLPANEKEFKRFIVEKGTHLLERAGVASVDELFISERDGQPFVVIYGKYPPGMASKIVAYEQDGVVGKRQVGYSAGAVELIDEMYFRELVPASAVK
jgi:hypothetical protein